MTALPVRLAHELDQCPEEKRWLIEGLWSAEACGIIGGEPKCCKSFLALEMAVAVAGGTACLGRFPTVRRGRVLLFAAEDSLAVVRERLNGLAAAANLDLASLDIRVIVEPVVRLDIDADRTRLEDTVRALRPALLVLDPFVRLHRIDENVSADVAPLLDFLRSLQRRYNTAIALVHHARKGAAHMRAGQALRGSSELHAWGDSNLYLRRQSDDELSLTIEHRAAPSVDSLRLALSAKDDSLALRFIDAPPVEQPIQAQRPIDRVEAVLAASSEPLTQRELRSQVKLRASTVSDALSTLVSTGRAARIGSRYEAIKR